MTDVKPKTPNKRKSLNPKEAPQSAKKVKQELSTPAKTPNKGKQSPKKGPFTFKPKNDIPVKEESPKKLQKFQGTPALNKQQQQPKVKVEKSDSPQKQQTKVKTEQPDSPKKGFKKQGNKDKPKGERKKPFHNFIEKVKGGNAELAKTLAKRVQEIEARGELSKTAKRKLNMLKKLQAEAAGNPLPAKVQNAGPKKGAVSESTKRRNRKKAAAAKAVVEEKEKPGAQVKAEEDDEVPAGKKQKAQKKAQIKKAPVVAPPPEEDSDDDDEEEDDDEVEAEDEEDSDDDEAEVEEEEDDDDEEAEDEEDSDAEEEEDSDDE